MAVSAVQYKLSNLVPTYKVHIVGSSYRIPGQFNTLTLTVTQTLTVFGQVFYNGTYLHLKGKLQHVTVPLYCILLISQQAI